MLDISDPWYVKDVTILKESNQFIIEVALKKGIIWADPTKATAQAHVNGWSERQWRHLYAFQFKTIIKARVPQLKYSDGTVKELPVFRSYHHFIYI